MADISTGELVTVVVAVLNRAEQLPRCLQSFVEQRHSAKELVVIDGGSSDGSTAVLTEFDEHISHWESEADRGIYHAWNKALNYARGEWICFLGADDYFWNADALATAARHLATAYPPYRVVYGQVALVTERGRVVELLGETWTRVGSRFRSRMSLPHQGVFHHRSLFAEWGLFDESFRIAGDYELLLRELKEHDALFIPGLTVAAMQWGGLSTTPRHTLRALREFRRAQRQQSVDGVPWRWWWAYAKAMTKDVLHRVLGYCMARVVTDAYRRFSGRPPWGF